MFEEIEAAYAAFHAALASRDLSRLTPAELGAILIHAEAKLLFYENDFAPLVEHLRAAAPSMRVINLDTEYEEFIAQGKPERADIYSYDEDKICELFYTSGSTGTPKGVLIPHRAIARLVCQTDYAQLAPDDSEVHGLLALMEIQSSRAHARVGPEGEPILLLDQDRSQWDRPVIDEGTALVRAALQGGRPGR